MDSKDKIIVALAEMGEYRASSCYRAAVDLPAQWWRTTRAVLSRKTPADRLLEISTAARQCRLIRAVSDRWAWRDCADTLTLRTEIMAYDIYAQTPVDDGDGVRPQSDAEIEIELRNAARNGDLVVRRRTATGSEFVAGSEPVDLGGGAGIQPDATGTLAGRSTYDAEAAGFVYLATDQSPAEYYFRQGASGWSAAVTVRGPKGDTGPAGPAGATEQLDRLVPKEIRARPAPPARRAQPEQQAPQDRPAQQAQRSNWRNGRQGRCRRSRIRRAKHSGPSAANYDIWIVTP